MRAEEFINEGRPGKMHKDTIAVQQGVSKSRDPGGYDRVYHQNRFMMAAALSDGSGKPVDMDDSSWVEKYNTMHPYTELEHKMIKSAAKTIPTDFKQVTPWSKSKEPVGGHPHSSFPDRKKLAK